MLFSLYVILTYRVMITAFADFLIRQQRLFIPWTEKCWHFDLLHYFAIKILLKFMFLYIWLQITISTQYRSNGQKRRYENCILFAAAQIEPRARSCARSDTPNKITIFIVFPNRIQYFFSIFPSKSAMNNVHHAEIIIIIHQMLWMFDF